MRVMLEEARLLARGLAYHSRARLEAAVGRALEEVDGQIEELRAGRKERQSVQSEKRPEKVTPVPSKKGAGVEEERLEEGGREMARIVYFSDAVFAIAITLLVLQIRVPAGLSPTELPSALVEMWPRFLSYLISFTVIGSFWRAHHRIFRHIRSYDESLIYLNLLFLMCVAFLPFSASLIGEYGSQPVAFEIYAGNVAATGLLLGGAWWHATRDGRLTGGDLDPGLIRQLMAEQLSLPVTALVFVPISFFFGVTVAAYSVIAFLLIASVVRRILPRLRDRSRAQESTEEHGEEEETKR